MRLLPPCSSLSSPTIGTNISPCPAEEISLGIHFSILEVLKLGTAIPSCHELHLHTYKQVFTVAQTGDTQRAFKLDDVVAALCAQGLETEVPINPTTLVAKSTRRNGPEFGPWEVSLPAGAGPKLVATTISVRSVPKGTLDAMVTSLSVMESKVKVGGLPILHNMLMLCLNIVKISGQSRYKCIVHALSIHNARKLQGENTNSAFPEKNRSIWLWGETSMEAASQLHVVAGIHKVLREHGVVNPKAKQEASPNLKIRGVKFHVWFEKLDFVGTADEDTKWQASNLPLVSHSWHMLHICALEFEWNWRRDTCVSAKFNCC